MSRILIAGCGSIGSELGMRLAKSGHQVWGIRRNSSQIPTPITPIAVDLRTIESLGSLSTLIDYVFIILTADNFDEQSYKQSYVDCTHKLLRIFEDRRERLKRIFFVSSTSVYGQTLGEWVDETSITNPRSFSGRQILEAESLLEASPLPTTCIRMAGIYGPGRTRMFDRIRNQEVDKTFCSSSYRNLIHQDDVVGILHHLISVDQPSSMYIGVDHEPVSTVELVKWLADRLGVSLPIAHGHTGTKTKRSGTNKRCRNDRILQSGYCFKFPTYKEGYGEIVRKFNTGNQKFET